MPDRMRARRQNHADRLDRVTDSRTIMATQRKARYITKKYPLRAWAIWTSRKFGFWSHVVNGNINKPGGIRLTWRDVSEVARVCDYIRTTEKRRTAALDALREAMVAISELEHRFDDLAREIARL